MRSEDEEKEIEATKAPLLEHLVELRARLIKALIAFAVAFVACFFFAKQIYNVLIWPFEWVHGPDSKFIYTALLEYFVTQLKVAMFGAAFISFPVVASQIYKFVAPGLYRNERQAFLPYLIATPVFFVMGAAVVYSWSCQCWCGSRSACSRAEMVEPRSRSSPKSASTLSLVMSLIVRVRCRVPVAGDPDAARPRRAIITSQQLKEKRRYFIVICFIIAAVLTPPDVLSQMSLAIPLLILYEGSIFAVRAVEKKAAAAAAASAGASAAAAPKPAE
jgi:Twin arginine targeting (Tat) protein translocase TatC